jgi:hypothetical protein
MKSTQYNKLFLIVYSVVLILIVLLVLKTEPSQPILAFIFSAIFILFLSIALSFYKLTVSVNEEFLSFSFGIGIFKKKYGLSKIKNCKPAIGKFSIYSRISFEKLPNNGKSYVLSSALPSVEITYENDNGLIKTDRVGTDKPSEISDYINKIIGQHSSLTS